MIWVLDRGGKGSAQEDGVSSCPLKCYGVCRALPLIAQVSETIVADDHKVGLSIQHYVGQGSQGLLLLGRCWRLRSRAGLGCLLVVIKTKPGLQHTHTGDVISPAPCVPGLHTVGSTANHHQL